MMPQFHAYLLLLVVHWIADFVLQTHWQAQNKSKRLDALARHVFVYTAMLLFMTPIIFSHGSYRGWCLFVFFNGILHFGTDYFTSRWTSRLYIKQDWHNFFVVVGLDQLIHQFTLAITMWAAFYE
jgi:Protein of unknown function (DUF3307)